MLKKWQNEDGSFKGLSGAEIDALNEVEANEYHDAFKAYSNEKEVAMKNEIESLKSDAEANKEKIATIEARLETVKGANEILELRLKGQGEDSKTIEKVNSIVKALEDKAEEIKNIRKGDVSLTIKATHNASDIDSGTDFAQMLSGVGQIATRRPFIKDFIRVSSTNTEYIKYVDQETITRDAKNVAACAESTHTSKVTWKTYTLQQQKVRDFTHVCLDMMEDYSFVSDEIRNLINTDVALQVDSQLLLGDGIAPNLNGIASYASTFNAAAAGADYSLSVENATLIDLIQVAAAQIRAFGQNNKFNANVILMNPKDVTLMKLTKDANENYMIPNWITSDGMNVSGVRVIENPLVPENEAYIMDSTKAVIYQAKTQGAEMSFENRQNFEHEMVTVKAYERLNLLVRNTDANAFMHIPSLSAAVTAITAV